MAILDGAKDFIYPFQVELQKVVTTASGGVNVFDYNYSLVDGLIALLIFLLIISSFIKMMQKEEKNWKDFALKAGIALIIAVFMISWSLFSSKPQIIEWDAYTYQYLVSTSDSQDTQDTGVIPNKTLISQGYLFEGTNNSWLQNIKSHWNGGTTSANGIYIKPTAVYQKLNLITDVNSEDFKTNYKFPSYNWILGWYDGVSWLSAYYTEFPAGISYFWNGRYALSTIENWISVDSISPTDYVLVDDKDFWVWIVAKVTRTTWRMEVTLSAMPNMYTYQLEQTFNQWIASTDVWTQSVYKEYKERKEENCSDVNTCNYSDILLKKEKDIQTNDISLMLSYISLIEKGFNFQYTSDGIISNFAVFVNGVDYKSVLWFYTDLQSKGSSVFSFGTDYTGLNFSNNKNIFAYYVKDETSWETIRNTYDLWIYSESSMYKKFFSTLVGVDSIWFGTTILLFLLYILWPAIYLGWTYFIVKIVNDILE